MTKTSEDLEREVEASRSDLDRTVEALKEKMTPGQLFDEASRAMGGAGQQVLSKFVDQAKENPMPLAVMGLGLAWLMTGNNRPRPASSGYGAPYEPRSFAGEGYAGERGSSGDGMVSSVGHKLSDAVSGAKDAISHTASGLGEKGRSATEAVHSAADTARHKVQDYGRQAQRSFGHVLESEPLLIGAAALVVGAAIGAALPSSDVEDKAVGGMRDKVLDRGKDLATDALHQAQGAATAAYSAVKSELRDDGADDDRDPAQKAEDVARRATQAAQEALLGQQPS